MPHSAAKTSVVSPGPSRVPLCHHILPGGRPCRSIALKGREFCYFHESGRERPDPAHPGTIDLRPMHNRADIQRNLSTVLVKLAQNEIRSKEAGKYLLAIRLAMTNLDRAASPVRRP